MPSLRIFTPDETLPLEYEYQIRAYVRMLWHDEYLYTIDAPMMPPERHAHWLVLAERHALFSAGRVIWVDVPHAGETYKTYCLGDVFTYPAFRRRGYGAEIVQAATALIRADPAADLAVLFTSPETAGFYERHGWQAMPDMQATMGDADAPESYGALPMMLFLSERANAKRAQFERAAIHFPGWGW